MAVHTEIVPSGDPALGIGLEALRLARMRMTSNAGSSYWPMGDGTGILLGDQAQDGANRVDANGNQLPLIDTSRIEAEAESASKKADEAIKQGEQIRQDAQAGVDDVRKQAQDAAAKAEQTRQAAEAGVAEAKADAAASGAKAEQVRKDTETMVRAVRDSVDAAESKAQNASEKADKLAGSITDVTATVNGHSTRLKELSTKVEGAVTQNGQTVESVTELKQTVTGMRATVTQNSKTATDALSKATSVEQTANGITATLSKDYQTAKAADAKYSTKTELTATSSGLTSKITEAAKKGDAAMSKVTTLEQTANGLSAKVGETAKTLDATVQTVNQVKSTADSNKATISQVSTTANDALSRTSSLEQNLSGFKSEVGQTYATKSDMGKQSSGSNLWCNQLFDPDKPQITRLVDNVTAPNGSRTNLLAGRDHFNAATGFPVVPGHTYVITAYCKPIKGGKSLRAGLWYTQQTSGHPYDGLVGAESTTPLDDGWMTATWRFTCPYGKSRGCVYFQIDNWPPNNASTQWLVANVTCTDVTGLQPAGDYATNSSLSQTADSIKASVAENARKADAAMSKASSVEQTASGLSTRISEVARKGDQTVQSLNTLSADVTGFKQTVQQTYATGARVSRLESSLDGFRSTVSQTYSPKSEVTDLAASTVRRYRLNMTGAAAWYKIGFWQPLGQGSVAAIHVYTGRGTNGGEDQNSEFTIMLKKGWVGSSNNHRNDYGVNLIRQRNAANVQVKAFAYHPSGQDPDTTPVDIWIYQPWGYGGGHYDVSYDGSWSHQTTVQKDAPVEDSTHTLQVSVGYETLSNMSYVDQTSRSVSLGVVEEYKNGRHGSALATSADITAAKDSITSTVSSTYATKTGVTQEISSKITQNNNSLDVRFATKTETRAAQDTANTANSHASDAQSRVGSLESCIRMTSAGVRVGHIVNGGFQGYSALVSSQGSFDVLDYSGRTVATFRDSILDLLNGLVRLRNANNTGELLIKAPDGTYGYLSYNSDGMFLKSPTGSIRLEPKPGCNVFTRSKAIQPSQSGLCNKATDANGIISVDNLSPPDGNANNGILSVTVTPINIGQDPTLLAFTPVIWAKGANGFQVRLKTNNNTWVSGAQPYAFCWHVVWA
ncbi:hypothetical protein MCC02036_01190 [Bifidobacteriaceae bacterium MCC02036]|nr:hypothetical protein MCC02036_01190 [Bifidobacteriaceae bacterium MCC02036]